MRLRLLCFLSLITFVLSGCSVPTIVNPTSCLSQFSIREISNQDRQGTTIANSVDP
jgi:hypothetical protein